MNEWLVIFGVFSALGSFVYRLNGHRGLVLNGRTDVDSMHRVPTAVAAGTGFLMLGFAWWFRGSEPSAGAQISILALLLVLIVAFGVSDYRVWSRAVGAKA